MKLKINEFENNLKDGQKQEKTVRSKISLLFPTILEPFIKEYSYKYCPKIQLSGKDGGIHFDWDVKSRNNCYYWVADIALEIKVGRNIGWFYKDMDIVFYGILNKEKSDYLKNKAWILFMRECKDFFNKEKLENYESKWALSKNKDGIKWWTENKIVPIIDFPKNCLIPFPIEYWNLKIEKKKDTQNTIEQWLE